MKTLTRTNMVVFKDYDHMTIIMNEDMKWMKVTHLVSIFSLNVMAPFSTFAFTLKEV
jgi:hypothetical protein